MLARDSRMLGWPVVAAILLAFYVFMLGSLVRTSQTFDESVYPTAGYAFWQYNDYRLNPENGNLPQRLQALPLWLANYKFIGPESDLWRTADKWQISWRWFYELGNDVAQMILLGRASSGLLAVALGALVWGWSREIFGALGGMLSLLVYVLNPTVLANGALMTADMAAALFFFAATWAWWRVLQRFTITRVVISSLAIAGLFLSKMSAPLIVVVVLSLCVIRLVRGGALPAAGFGMPQLRTREAQVAAFAMAALIHAVVVLIAIWSFHGFRYAAAAPVLPNSGWIEAPWEWVLNKPAPAAIFEKVGLGPAQRKDLEHACAQHGASLEAWSVAALKAIDAFKRSGVLAEQQIARFDQLAAEAPAQFIPRTIELLRQARLLPEAYLYGFAHVWRGARERAAFFNGEFSLTGWRTFFPYTFFIKTPLSVFVVIGLAIAAAVVGRSRSWYETAPVWVLFAVYWAGAFVTNLNIGHRHILPTYPALFVLCGAAAWWLTSAQRFARIARVTLVVALALLAAEVGYRFPHYLAYFNGLVRPGEGYRHLVDSSLDWGQDLPGVRDYLQSRRVAEPAYLFYYGSANPVYYQVPAIYGYSFQGRHRTPPLQILTFSSGEWEQRLREFGERERDYDTAGAMGARVDGNVSVVFAKTPAALRLTAGTYLVSATLLQPVTSPGRGVFGSWNQRVEDEYQRVRQFVSPMLSDDMSARQTLVGEYGPENVRAALDSFDYLRFRRLTSFLRQRAPDDNVGYSILVYRVSEEELAQALEGPPLELGRDILSEIYGPPR